MAPSRPDIIPNIDIARVADPRLADARVHYGTLGGLAEIFGWTTGPHRHDQSYQLHLLEAGSLDLTMDGVAYAARAPLVFFTPPSVPHAFRLDYMAPGHVLTMDRSLARTAIQADPSIGEIDRPRCLALSGEEAARMTALFHMLRIETESTAPAAGLAAEAIATLLLIAVLRLDVEDRPDTLPRRHEQILFRQFADLVEQHFAERWTLTRYADALSVTESRLTGIARRVAGKSPKQIVLDRAMLEARRLLAFSNHSVLEIGARLGFDDAAYFSRLVRERHGRPPSQYRTSADVQDAAAAA
jgi:AraC family 4-hydroxyphenylacetate 3-monooxygenase operon regulatory protein